MKAVNTVSALSSSQPVTGAQPAAGFRKPASGNAGDAPVVIGFAGQLANLSSAQEQRPVAHSPDMNQHTAEQVQPEASSPEAESGQDLPEASPHPVTEQKLAEIARKSTAETPLAAVSGKELPQGSAASALTELVRGYLSSGRTTPAPEAAAPSGDRATPVVMTVQGQRTDGASTQTVSQEYQRLLATMEQRLTPAEVRGLDNSRGEALKAAMQSGGSSAGATISAQSLLDSRPDLLTGSQRNPIVSEWAPIKVATQQPHHWGRDLMAALGDRLSMQINQNVKEARIRLDPPELGRIEMTVRLEGDRLNVQLNAGNHQVRDILAQHADRLRMDLMAQNTQSVDVHVGQEGDRRDSRPAYGNEEIIAAGLAVEDTSDSNTPERDSNSWLSTKA